MNRKKLALFILLIVLVLTAAWSYRALPRQKTVSTLKYAPGQKSPARKTSAPAPAKAPGAQPVPVTATGALRLDLLEKGAVAFKGYRRNIFKPIFVDEFKIMKQKALAVKPVPIPPVAVQAQVQKPVETPAVVSDTPQKALATFTFLGFLKKDNRRTIFLSKGSDIILVKKGDKFAGNYEATSITDQALTIMVVSSGEQIVIPLIENRPLAAAKK
jgi:hypothetical protein